MLEVGYSICGNGGWVNWINNLTFDGIKGTAISLYRNIGERGEPSNPEELGCGWCNLSNKELAADIGMKSTGTISKSISELQSKGYLEIKNIDNQRYIRAICKTDFDLTIAKQNYKPRNLGIRYEVLKRANKRCELCGVQEGDEGYEDRLPLHIDHIEPRSKGGSNEIDNLQVLCRACNLGKSNRDNTDFREGTK
jgi:hypothetical protein